MKKFTLTGLAFTLSLLISAQTNVKLTVQHKLGAANFAYGTAAMNDLNNDFKLDRLHYYMSGFAIVHDGGQVTTASTVYALVDAAQQTTIDLGSFNGITTVEQIRFAVGVNTPENNQDPALWPGQHALAPKSPSMHWGWASGYFFVAIEGKTGPALDKTLEMHALGNANYATQTITTGATLSNGDLMIGIIGDYTQALKAIDVSAGLILHGGNGNNASMITNFKNNVFSAAPTQTSNVGFSEATASINAFEVYPNPSAGRFTISAKRSTNKAELMITDMTGRTIQELILIGVESTDIRISTPGIYFVSLKGSGITKKVLVY